MVASREGPKTVYRARFLQLIVASKRDQAVLSHDLFLLPKAFEKVPKQIPAASECLSLRGLVRKIRDLWLLAPAERQEMCHVFGICLHPNADLIAHEYFQDINESETRTI